LLLLLRQSAGCRSFDVIAIWLARQIQLLCVAISVGNPVHYRDVCQATVMPTD